MIKTYGFTRTYDDRDYDEEGKCGKINFKASGNLFPLYKSYTGKDLMSAYDEYITLYLKNAKIVESKTGMSAKEFEKLSAEKQTEKLVSLNIKFEDLGGEFINSVILAMFLNSLSPQDQTEALSLGLDCLPSFIFTDNTITKELIELFNQFILDSKKK
jgi:hypothetical protein